MCTQAYIPKRGLFYEHDDRLESGEEEEGDEDEEGKPKQEKSGDKSESGKPATDGSAEKAGLKPKRVFRSDAAEKEVWPRPEQVHEKLGRRGSLSAEDNPT